MSMSTDAAMTASRTATLQKRMTCKIMKAWPWKPAELFIPIMARDLVIFKVVCLSASLLLVLCRVGIVNT